MQRGRGRTNTVHATVAAALPHAPCSARPAAADLPHAPCSARPRRHRYAQHVANAGVLRAAYGGFLPDLAAAGGPEAVSLRSTDSPRTIQVLVISTQVAGLHRDRAPPSRAARRSWMPSSRPRRPRMARSSSCPGAPLTAGALPHTYRQHPQKGAEARNAATATSLRYKNN